ncbi:MAG: hypothetical protein LBQ89_03065 [Treponema sp.]|nr:hypothetical protein [Treponema sp.]
MGSCILAEDKPPHEGSKARRTFGSLTFGSLFADGAFYLTARLITFVFVVNDVFAARISKPQVYRATKMRRGKAWEWSEAE